MVGFFKKKIVLIPLYIISVLAIIGGTLLLVLNLNKQEERTISCSVVQEANHYSIKNTGNTDVYVRVAIVSNFVNEELDENGNEIIHWTTPEYTVVLTSTDKIKWQKHGNYYYLLSDIGNESISFATIDITSQAPTGYISQLQVLAEVVEIDAIANSWGVKITSDNVEKI